MAISISTKTETDGGPAFPLSDERMPSWEGMSIRDWFAGNVAANHMQLNDHNCNQYQAEFTAKWAYMVADAMLAERSKAEGRTP